MTRHMIKLAVGVADVADLEQRQAARRERLPDGRTAVVGYTRRGPREVDALLDGGSLYWVINRAIRCRQRFLGFDPRQDSAGESWCALLLDPQIVLTEAVARRPFQGWRYLDPTDAPGDIAHGGDEEAEMPDEMRAELRALRLI